MLRKERILQENSHMASVSDLNLAENLLRTTFAYKLSEEFTNDLANPVLTVSPV